MNYFEKHKKFCITLLSIVVVFYTIFLFVIPNVLNLNSFKNDIQKIVLDMANLKVDFESIKIITTPTLKAGASVKGVKLTYVNDKEIFSLDDAQVRISLLPLLFKTLQVSDVKINGPKFSFVYMEDGQIDFVKHFASLLTQTQPTSASTAVEMPFRISDKLPDVLITDYDLILTDEKTNNQISLNGDNLFLTDAIINKHLKIYANGKVLVNNSENVFYDVKVDSFWPVIVSSDSAQPEQNIELPYIDFINEIVKFSPKTNLKADLKISEKTGGISIDGYVNADAISVVLDNKKLPDSYIHAESKGNKLFVNSDLKLNNEENALVSAKIEHGKNLKLDLNCKAEKITFVGLQKFLSALLNSFHIKNDIDTFNTNGYITADFGFKTDSKKVESYGFFKILDGYIAHKLVPVKINDITVDVDFQNNSLNINKAGAKINDANFVVKGNVDSSANADITLDSGDINLSPLFNAFAPLDIKKAYSLQSGVINAKAIVKGNLVNIEPNVNISLNKFSLKDKLNLFVLANENTSLDIKTNGKSFDGFVDVKNANFKMNNPYLKLSIPNAKIKITPDTITIVPFDTIINSSKINTSGGIKNYAKKPAINIICDGGVLSSDIKNLLPKDLHSTVFAKGKIPLKARLTGDYNKIVLNAQSYADKDNFFAPLTIQKLSNKPALFNLSLNYTNDILTLNDASLYQSVRSEFSNDLTYNKKGALKIVGINGNIANLATTHPIIKMTVAIPEQLFVSVPALFNTSLNVKGDVGISGLLTSPTFKGFMSIKNVDIADILTKVQAVDVELTGNLLSAKVQNLDIGGTIMNVEALASTVFSNIFLVKDTKLTSSNFDVDNLFKVMDKMFALMPPATAPVPVGNSTTTVVLPVKISKGVIDIQKLKMKQIGGDFIATNITGDFNLINDLFKLNNLKTNVYGGVVTGKVTYHLGTTAITADVKGKDVEANPIVTVFVALKDQLMSNVDFNADVKLKGATYEEQMKTLNGVVDFSMKDGQMGSLGRFETFLKADNLLSQNFISTHVGSLINTVAPYNTGKFSYLDGDIKLVNGIAKLNSVKMSGPHMSLLITGDVDVLSMDSDMAILGSLSPEVNSALGVVSDLSVEKFAAYIPKFGAKIASAMNSYNAPLKESELAKIPALTPAKDNTKSFKVVLDGNMNNPPTAIKKFQWLNTPEKISAEQKTLESSVAQSLVTTPITKEQVKQQVAQTVKSKIESNEKVQEIKENKTVKTLTGIYNFYKNSQTKSIEPTQSAEQQ